MWIRIRRLGRIMAFYDIEKATGFFGGYNVVGILFEGWFFTLNGARNRIKKLEAADAWKEGSQ